MRIPTEQTYMDLFHDYQGSLLRLVQFVSCVDQPDDIRVVWTRAEDAIYFEHAGGRDRFPINPPIVHVMEFTEKYNAIVRLTRNLIED